MEIYETLSNLRKKLKFTQKEILPDLDPSVYSRIESGKQEIKVNDLKKILDKLSLSPEEVFSMAPLDKEQKDYKALFLHCAQNMHDENKRQELLNYYIKLSDCNKNLRELSNYFAIKSYFAQKWQEIDGVTSEELEEIYQLMLTKTYYQHYDYIIIRNAMRFLEKEEADILIRRIFLSKKEQDLPVDDSSYYILINAATSRIYEKEYSLARKYVQLAKKQDKDRKNLDYRINLRYLENLLDYLTIGDYQYMQRIQEYIHLAKDIGDMYLAEQLTKDIELILNDIPNIKNKNDLPIILMKNN
ncbi:transcriptional regulator with XRE-family HTH domain [Enterococcus rotai]|uniref:HTH cro/C1-type domain-containing protein n=1 Tax=Enterococcus rotai TaxID=118060 RepID=A0A0U2X9K7_9ENTE|nr:helix-turn-helix transcriptional regulator [Enterococcus rotai]ALS36752.1 hypothetical protein ATZ35_06160 [Enterococcus rotai]